MATRIDAEVQWVRMLDRKWGAHQSHLNARMAAVIGAQQAVIRRELGALPALRQSLIDLAAAARGAAAELPPPAELAD